MSEKNGVAWWEGFILQDLVEFLNGFSFCVCVNSNRFPEGNTILWHLVWILATRQRQDRCYLCEFLKGAYQYIAEIVIGNMKIISFYLLTTTLISINKTQFQMDTIINIKSGQDINLSLNQIGIENENKNSISFSIIMFVLFFFLIDYMNKTLYYSLQVKVFFWKYF